MTKERELLKRALWLLDNFGSLDYYTPSQTLRLEVRDFLAAEEGKQEEEPVAWQWLHSGHFRKKIPANANKLEWYPLFLHPSPQAKQRKPLSEEEIIEAFRESCVAFRWPSTAIEIVRAVEKHHGIGRGDE